MLKLNLLIVLIFLKNNFLFLCTKKELELGCGSVLEDLPSMCQVLGLNPAPPEYRKPRSNSSRLIAVTSEEGEQRKGAVPMLKAVVQNHFPKIPTLTLHAERVRY